MLAGEITRPLVPDVAFPLRAPTVDVEILSPDDRRADVDDPEDSKNGTSNVFGSL